MKVVGWFVFGLTCWAIWPLETWRYMVAVCLIVVYGVVEKLDE